jgi:hypothetical protein
MNCSTCRYELSQCLDGRLPSGRRTLVLQHAESCSECGAFWTELQAAQQLTLHLHRPRVSPGFRDQLWERIRAGEGTPEAVFHEPVPLLTKLRYALTGAAAAAALLATAMWISRDPQPQPSERLVARDPAQPTPQVVFPGDVQPAPSGLVSNHATRVVDDHDAYFDRVPADPLLASSTRLTFALVATETAKQLDQCHATATMALRRFEQDPAEANRAVEDVFESVDQFQAFGEVLIDLDDRRRIHFIDPQVGADLRVAIAMLGQSRLSPRDQQTVRSVVMPALRSNRLGVVSETISLIPSRDRRGEWDVLARLNTLRPEVFRQLFVVLGQEGEMDVSGRGVLYLQDDCGPSWVVAPRSAIEANEGLLRMLRGNRREGVELQIEMIQGR